MFYNATAIETLTNRIGWAAPIPPTDLVVSADVTRADSGRYVRDFHPMAIVENIAETQPQYAASQEAVNAFMVSLKGAAVRAVLARIFDGNERAYYRNGANGVRESIAAFDYSDRIITQPGLFDNVIGYQMAYDALELMGNAIRSNQTQRLSQYNYGQIKAEQDGYTDENGKPVDRGIAGKLTAAIREVNNILFPETSTPVQPRIYNASYRW